MKQPSIIVAVKIVIALQLNYKTRPVNHLVLKFLSIFLAQKVPKQKEDNAAMMIEKSVEHKPQRLNQTWQDKASLIWRHGVSYPVTRLPLSIVCPCWCLSVDKSG